MPVAGLTVPYTSVQAPPYELSSLEYFRNSLSTNRVLDERSLQPGGQYLWQKQIDILSGVVTRKQLVTLQILASSGTVITEPTGSYDFRGVFPMLLYKTPEDTFTLSTDSTATISQILNPGDELIYRTTPGVRNIQPVTPLPDEVEISLSTPYIIERRFYTL